LITEISNNYCYYLGWKHLRLGITRNYLRRITLDLCFAVESEIIVDAEWEQKQLGISFKIRMKEQWLEEWISLLMQGWIIVVARNFKPANYLCRGSCCCCCCWYLKIQAINFAKSIHDCCFQEEKGRIARDKIRINKRKTKLMILEIIVEFVVDDN